jgi:2-(3-amino-3-carboxypropyl)histidine synthase
MEDDRAQVDVGIAADIEEAHTSQPAIKQPKKRFIGRRTADASARPGNDATTGGTGAVQSNVLSDTMCSDTLV